MKKQKHACLNLSETYHQTPHEEIHFDRKSLPQNPHYHPIESLYLNDLSKIKAFQELQLGVQNPNLK